MDFLGSIIAYPFRWINMISPNYVVTLILFAIFMKLVLFPFGIKQQKNSIKQAKLRPYETIIRKKYAGRKDQKSQQAMQQEIMELYQRENFNPMGGCLPMLIQLPVLFALYSVITKPVKFLMNLPELSAKVTEICKQSKITAGYEILQINDLIKIHDGTMALPKESEIAIEKIEEFLAQTVNANGAEMTLIEHFNKIKDSFTVFGLNLMEKPEIGDISILWVIPALVLVFSFLSMKLTRKFTYQPPANNDAATSASFKLMDYTMPLMSAWISFITPAGIGIYWVIQNILGVLQQYILYKLYPVPVMTDEELRLAEKELRGRSKPKKAETSEKESVSAPASAGGKKKNRQPASRKPSISAHGKARIKAHGAPPSAIRRP
ncbi:MAG: YidC/Oxa1 family membrane protein insertase [Clostridia bacterium]|nr:YidC/Oxa1 family membrane protein insertase [Clostridia bacterium]